MTNDNVVDLSKRFAAGAMRETIRDIETNLVKTYTVALEYRLEIDSVAIFKRRVIVGVKTPDLNNKIRQHQVDAGDGNKQVYVRKENGVRHYLMWEE